MYQQIAMVTAVTLPLFNIPLIIRMIMRRSSKDISLWWAAGVWVCTMIMAPAGFYSDDTVWRIYNIVNSVLFTCVFVTVMFFRLRRSGKR